MKLSLKWLIPTVVFVAVVLWLVVPKSGDADKNNSLEAQFDDLGIISQIGLVPAADMALADLNDQRNSLADFKGKIVLLNLWATWCPECVREMPALEKLQNKLGREDFAVVAVDLKETREVVAKFAKKYKLTFKILLDRDGKMGDVFNVRSIPTTYLIGSNGQLLGRVMGARDWDDSKYLTLFRKLISANKTVTAAKQTGSVAEKAAPAHQ